MSQNTSLDSKLSIHAMVSGSFDKIDVERVCSNGVGVKKRNVPSDKTTSLTMASVSFSSARPRCAFPSTRRGSDATSRRARSPADLEYLSIPVANRSLRPNHILQCCRAVAHYE